MELPEDSKFIKTDFSAMVSSVWRVRNGQMVGRENWNKLKNFDWILIMVVQVCKFTRA